MSDQNEAIPFIQDRPHYLNNRIAYSYQEDYRLIGYTRLSFV
ncbi:hypothetical protein [Halobacillus litoralis]|nr:hypothetical protein [Halobacillus litoralis]